MSSALLFLLIAFAPYHVNGANSEPPAEVLLLREKLLVSEFYPCALCNDEYVTLFNPSLEAVNLRGWSIGDGEGILRFASDAWIAPSSHFVISWNASSYLAAYSKAPDLVLPGDPGSIQVNISGSFRLSDEGDSITLFSVSGEIIDRVLYGREDAAADGWFGPNIPKFRDGEVARRIRAGGSYQDTDSSTDWFPFREYRYGYTQIGLFRASIEPSGILAFTSPDCSLDVVLEAIRAARYTIRLCTYELSSISVCISLLERLGAGVKVNIMVDGAPSGGIDLKQTVCLSVLARSGACIRLVNGNMSRDIVQHVGPMHAKYLVVDSVSALVISENFVESGLPVDRVFGNRGWGIWVQNAAVAQHLQMLFDSDFRIDRTDVLPWDEDPRYDRAASLEAEAVSNHTVGMIAPFRTSSSGNVTIYVSPDASPDSPFLESILKDASSLEIEQFQADLYWTPRWSNETVLNPMVASIQRSCSRGALSRLLLDSSWFNIERNTEVVSHLSAASPPSAERQESKLLDQRSPITVLHNKGIIVDRHWTLVSSNNWVFSSFARNREIAVLVESDQVASYFAGAFDYDWRPDETPPEASASGDTRVRFGQRISLDASESSDDRLICDMLWDVGCDGTVDYRGIKMEFYPTSPGRTQVLLVVVDAWGNRDTYQVTVSVLTEYSAQSDEATASRSLLFLGSASALFGLLLGASLARRRIGAVRKVNQSRRG